MIKSITFDVARTLMGFKDSINWRLISDELVSCGFNLYPQELQAARDYVFMVDLAKLNLDNWVDWTTQIFHRLDYNNVDKKIIQRVVDHLQQSTNSYYLFDDVIPMFQALEQYHLSYSLLTTIPEFKLENVMKPIRTYLNHITHGGNAGCVKGNPRMYQLDLKWKNIDASSNLFVGDHPYLDIEIPQSMGQRTVHIQRDGVTPEQEGRSEADYQITSLQELPEIMAKLNK